MIPTMPLGSDQHGLNPLHSQFFLICSITLLLSLLTTVLYETVDRYADVGGELLENHSFDAGLTGWHPSRNVNKNQRRLIDLSNWKSSEGHDIRQILPKPSSGMVRISADVTTINVETGPKSWQRARIDVLGRKANGKWQWDFPNTLFRATGTSQLRDISTVIKIPDEFTELRVQAELTGGTGTFLVDRISLKEVKERLLIIVLSYLLLACWVVLGTVVIVLMVRMRMWIPATIILTAGTLLLLIPDTIKTSILNKFEKLIPAISHLPLDHLFLFMMATFVIYYTSHGKPATHLWKIAFGLITFSFASEALQYFTNHRDPLLRDLAANVAGITLGILVYLAAKRMIGKTETSDL
jgi:hypothetical protein